MPLFTAIATGISAVTAAVGLGAITGAQVAWFAFTTALTFGVSALQRGGERRQPQANAEAPRGQELSLNASPNHPRTLILGKRATAGSLVYRCTSGASNDVLHQVISLADHEIEGITRLWVEDQLIEWSATSTNDTETFNVPAYTVGGVDYLRITLYKGRASNSHASDVTTASGGQWTSDHLGKNVAYVVVRTTYSQDVFRSGGVPRILFEVQGAKLYDPRKDSTQTGGSGSHRFGQPATYEYSDNLELARYNFLRGIGDGGNGRPLFGPGLAAHAVNVSAAMAAMNVCDQTVNLRAGGSEKRYRVAAVIPANEEFEAVLDRMSSACAGSYPNLSGRYAIRPGTAQTPVLALTDDDLDEKQPVRGSRYQSIGQVPNEVTGNWADPASQYERTPVPTRFSSADEATDGGYRRTNDHDLEYVASQSQGQRVLEIVRRLGRRQGEHTVTFRPRASVLEAGDWFTWSSDIYGYSDKIFRVEQCALMADFSIQMNIREIDAAVYDWDPATDEILASQPADLPPGGPTLSVVDQFDVDTAVVVSPDGTQTPAIRATWTAITDPTVTGLLIEYRRVGDIPYMQYLTSRDQVTAGAATIIEGILGSVEYEARARLKTDPPRQVTIIAPVTAGNVTQPVVVNRAQLSTVTEDVRPGIITADDLIPSLRDSVEDETRSSNLLSELIVSRVRESTQGLSIARDIGKLRADVALGLAPISADLTRLDQVSADLQAQIASTATTAAANNATTAAAVVVEQGARTAGDEAEAAARTTAVAQLTTDLATVSSAVSAIAGPTGITAAKLDTLEVTAVDTASQSTLGAFVQAVERGTIDDDLKRRVGLQNARIEESRVVGVVNGQAIAAIDTRLASETNARQTQVATINNSLTTLTDAQTAQATTLTTVEARANQATASGLVGLVAVATASGAVASFRVQLRTVVGGTARDVGQRLDILADGSTRIEFDAGKIINRTEQLQIASPSVNSGTPVDLFSVQSVDGTNRFVFDPSVQIINQNASLSLSDALTGTFDNQLLPNSSANNGGLFTHTFTVPAGVKTNFKALSILEYSGRQYIGRNDQTAAPTRLIGNSFVRIRSPASGGGFTDTNSLLFADQSSMAANGATVLTCARTLDFASVPVFVPASSGGSTTPRSVSIVVGWTNNPNRDNTILELTVKQTTVLFF
jgi:hypothetical protein